MLKNYEKVSDTEHTNIFQAFRGWVRAIEFYVKHNILYKIRFSIILYIVTGEC